MTLCIMRNYQGCRFTRVTEKGFCQKIISVKYSGFTTYVEMVKINTKIKKIKTHPHSLKKWFHSQTLNQKRPKQIRGYRG